MRSQATAFGTASTSTSPSQRTGRTSRNQVFQVPSASCARSAVLPASQRSAASDDTTAVEANSMFSTGPSTSVEKGRERREAPLIMMTGRPAAGGGTPTGEDRRSEAVTKGERANLAN